MHYSNIPSFQYSSLCYVGARRLSATKHMSLFSSLCYSLKNLLALSSNLGKVPGATNST
jgi:hypothetical protein